jgi:hypothetical protein
MRTQDRRFFPRVRKPFPVLVLDPADALEEPYRGWVVDRSRGGVCLALNRTGLEIGNVLMVQPRSAAAALPWISLKVKNRRVGKKRVDLGCEFVQRDRWERLLFL